MCTHTHTFTHMPIHTHTHTGVAIAQGGGRAHGNKAERAPQGVLEGLLWKCCIAHSPPGEAQDREGGREVLCFRLSTGKCKQTPDQE